MYDYYHIISIIHGNIIHFEFPLLSRLKENNVEKQLKLLFSSN